VTNRLETSGEVVDEVMGELQVGTKCSSEMVGCNSGPAQNSLQGDHLLPSLPLTKYKV
jgi:hypothetical protein